MYDIPKGGQMDNVTACIIMVSLYFIALLIVRAIEGKRKQTYSDLAKEMPHTKDEIQDFVEGLKRTGSYEKIKKLLFDRTIEVMPRNGMFTHYRQDGRMGVFG